MCIRDRVGLTQLDKEMIENLSENRHKIFLIANKSDKLKQLSYQEQIELIEKEAKDIPIIGYSAKTKKGRDELLEVIERQLKNFSKKIKCFESHLEKSPKKTSIKKTAKIFPATDIR